MLAARVQVHIRISFTQTRTELRGFWNGSTALLMSPVALAVQLNNLCARCAVQGLGTPFCVHAKIRQLTHGCKPNESFMTVTASRCDAVQLSPSHWQATVSQSGVRLECSDLAFCK